MSPALSFTGDTAMRPRGGRDIRALIRGVTLAIVLGGAVAIGVGYAPVPRLLLVIAAVGALVVLVVFVSTATSAVLLGLALPWDQDITGGHLGLHIAASDVLLVLIGLRAIAEALLGRRVWALASIRPARLPLLQYAWALAALLVFHLGFTSALKSMQRLELFALPVFVGAYLALRGKHLLVLRGYVVSAAVLSVVWPVLNAHGLTGQLDKNPTAGFIATAILLLLVVRELRPIIWCMPVLLVGLGLTASRGAVVSLGVGIVVIVLMVSTTSGRAVALSRIAALLLIALVAFQFLPSNVTSRLTNFTAGEKTRSSYAIEIRLQLAQGAEQVIAAHPWLGVGVGNYVAGSAAQGDQVTDPHDVILLEAAEGGYLFAASFIAMILGLWLVLWRLREVRLALAAAAVLLATFAHGLVDVYWVRGTPVLGFLLVGMVCGLAAQRRNEEAT
ncbi:MAG: O-antigen ligase family protein [Solirubrobacteraceae bacterium]|jgi:hypothetical protein